MIDLEKTEIWKKLEKYVRDHEMRLNLQEEVLRELLDLFGACEFEGQTHEKDLTYEQKYDKLQELWTNLGGEIEQYGRKDGNPSLSVKPTDTSKPPSICALQEQKKCYSSKSIMALPLLLLILFLFPYIRFYKRLVFSHLV